MFSQKVIVIIVLFVGAPPAAAGRAHLVGAGRDAVLQRARAPSRPSPLSVNTSLREFCRRSCHSFCLQVQPQPQLLQILQILQIQSLHIAPRIPKGDPL